MAADRAMSYPLPRVILAYQFLRGFAGSCTSARLEVRVRHLRALRHLLQRQYNLAMARLN
jgi:hypothetical protein